MTEEIEEIIEKNKDLVRKYPDVLDRITIATICSHSSLQIFNSAKKAGFKTLGIIKRSNPATLQSYDLFPGAKPDDFIIVEDYSELIEDPRLIPVNNDLVFIPHGSGVEYLRIPGEFHGLEVLPIPTYGNRRVIPWEASREKQKHWLEKAGLKMPKEITDPSKIDGPTIIKLKGAPGGRGAAILTSEAEYNKFMEMNDVNPDGEDYQGSTMQELIVGTRYYLQFLATPFQQFVKGNVEFFGMDRRDESNADEFYKAGSRKELFEQGIFPTFNVTGNVPIVMRESLLMKTGIPAGVRTAEAASELMDEGLIGPYCLETVVDRDGKMFTFEISARIVAGSNVLVNGSPYGRLVYGDKKGDMNYADRMMMDIAEGARRRELDRIIT